MDTDKKLSNEALSEPLQQCIVISCNNLTPKERLSKKLAEITQESKNLILKKEKKNIGLGICWILLHVLILLKL